MINRFTIQYRSIVGFGWVDYASYTSLTAAVKDLEQVREEDPLTRYWLIEVLVTDTED